MAAARLDFDADFFPVRQLGLKAVTVDHDVQSRVRTDPEHVAKIVVFLKARGPISEPVIVFFDGKNYWLADGFHRVEAHRQLSREKGFQKFGSIMAEIRPGTKRDAIVYSAGANQEKTYLKRTLKDIERAVAMLLADPEWADRAPYAIANHVGITGGTAKKFINDYYVTNKIEPPLVRRSVAGNPMKFRPISGGPRPGAGRPVIHRPTGIDLISSEEIRKNLAYFRTKVAELEAILISRGEPIN